MHEAFFEFLTAHYWAYYLFFVFGAAARSQTMYWIGRYGNRVVMNAGEPSGAVARRAWKAAHDRETQRMAEEIHRRGVIVVPLGFLTIGLQTLINIAAGLTRMPWKRYTLACVPGWLVWAAIYSTVGLAVVAKPVTALVVVLIAAIAYGAVYRPLRRRRAAAEADPGVNLDAKAEPAHPEPAAGRAEGCAAGVGV